MSKILHFFTRRVKRQPRQLTPFEALDMSLQLGFGRVPWQAVNWRSNGY